MQLNYEPMRAAIEDQLHASAQFAQRLQDRLQGESQPMSETPFTTHTTKIDPDLQDYVDAKGGREQAQILALLHHIARRFPPDNQPAAAPGLSTESGASSNE